MVPESKWTKRGKRKMCGRSTKSWPTVFSWRMEEVSFRYLYMELSLVGGVDGSGLTSHRGSRQGSGSGNSPPRTMGRKSRRSSREVQEKGFGTRGPYIAHFCHVPYSRGPRTRCRGFSRSSLLVPSRRIMYVCGQFSLYLYFKFWIETLTWTVGKTKRTTHLVYFWTPLFLL